eukprot:1147314-Pelagomonas_calceolata.AAC.8
MHVQMSARIVEGATCMEVGKEERKAACACCLFCCNPPAHNDVGKGAVGAKIGVGQGGEGGLGSASNACVDKGHEQLGIGKQGNQPYIKVTYKCAGKEVAQLVIAEVLLQCCWTAA